jgi:hypothetical protein
MELHPAPAPAPVHRLSPSTVRPHRPVFSPRTRHWAAVRSVLVRPAPGSASWQDEGENRFLVCLFVLGTMAASAPIARRFTATRTSPQSAPLAPPSCSRVWSRGAPPPAIPTPSSHPHPHPHPRLITPSTYSHVRGTSRADAAHMLACRGARSVSRLAVH